MDVYGHLFPTNTDRAELAKSSRLLLGPPPDANVVPLRRSTAWIARHCDTVKIGEHNTAGGRFMHARSE